jgi:hypothetical protein
MRERGGVATKEIPLHSISKGERENERERESLFFLTISLSL